MRSTGICVLLLLMLFSFCAFPAYAAESDVQTGRVQYSALFCEYTSLRDTGIRPGTLSSKNAVMHLEDGELKAGSSDGEKSYLLLPTPSEWTDSYTVEFTFRFREISSPNGYCGLILSSTGDAPLGRLELLFRANGVVEGAEKQTFSALEEAADEGAPVTVRVLVQRGFLMNYEVRAGGDALSVTPSSLTRVGEDGRGFVIRNAQVTFSGIRVVSGDYAALDKAQPVSSYVAPPEWQLPQVSSPATGDTYAAVLVGAVTVSGAVFGRLLCRRRKV